MDKVQKIREEVARIQLYTQSEVLKQVLDYIDEVQKEPVSEKKCIFTKDSYTDEDRKVLCEDCKEECEYNKKEEPVSEEFEDAADNALSNVLNTHEIVNVGSCLEMFRFGAKWQQEKEYTCYEEAFEDGAKWKNENLWKPADGDDLPEIDREVIVLIKYNTQRNIHDKEYSTYKVGFGHRPNPNGWDGKNIDTNEVTHYTPKLYDKGGWNAPNIVYWLDAKLPYEENKIIK